MIQSDALRSVAVAFVIVALVAGCGEDDEERASWSGPRPAAARAGLDVRKFNEFLRQEGTLERTSPVLVALRYIGVDRLSAREIVISRGRGESERAARLTVTLDRLEDDSVRAIRYELVLARSTTRTWRLRGVRVTQRCWPGRGHQSFSRKLCL